MVVCEAVRYKSYKACMNKCRRSCAFVPEFAGCAGSILGHTGRRLFRSLLRRRLDHVNELVIPCLSILSDQWVF